MKLTYAKPHLSIPDQITQLKNRGMSIADESKAASYLQKIGYYRLSAYWNLFELPSTSVPRTHQFQTGTNFDKVLQLYVFDRKLRIHIMEALERIEVAARSLWTHGLSEMHGSHAYLESTQFTKILDYASDLNKIQSEVKRSKEGFIKHYMHTYNLPELPPIWAVVEVMTLGALSRWMQNTKDAKIVKGVAKQMGLPNAEVLTSALHALTPIRNTCAHHGRLWNKKFPITFEQPQLLQSRLVPKQGKSEEVVFNFLVLIDYLLSKISPSTTWTSRLLELLDELDTSEIKLMGFPNDWKTKEPWTSHTRPSNTIQQGVQP